MTILHINSSARVKNSNSRIIGQYLVEALKQPVINRDLAQQLLPPISTEDLVNVHGSSDSERTSLQAKLSLSDNLIDELIRANILVLAAPMYNFGIPALLKQWVDAICRAGISDIFHIDAGGSKGSPEQLIA